MDRLFGCRVGLVAVTAAMGVLQSVLAAETVVPTIESREDLRDLPARWAGVMETFGVPGMAIGVVKDGKVYAAQTWGVRDAKGNAPDLDTKFYIASITKTFTATTVAGLAASGKLKFDDAAEKYLPRFKLPSGSASDITIMDLLSHRKGVNCGVAVLLDAYTGEITDDRYYGLLARFGEKSGKVAYTNVHFTLLGRVIERVTGQPWRVHLEQGVLRPAGMTRTSGFIIARDPNSATPMLRIQGGYKEITPWKTDATMHAAGGLDSTARDMMRWIELHVNDGTVEGTQVFPAGVLAPMTRVEAKLDKPQGQLRIMNGFGMAWQVGTYKGTTLASHGGGYAGTNAYVAILPEKKAGFVLLMNAGVAARGLSDVIAIDLLERLTDSKDGTSVLDPYVAMAKKQGIEPEPRAATIAGDAVTPRLRSALGSYTNELVGTLTLETREGGVGLRVGAHAMDVESTEGGFAIPKDTLLGPSMAKIESDNPAALTLKHPTFGELVFTRVKK